jgi:hypothetical protein
LVTLLLAAKNSLDSLDNSVDGNYLNVNMNLAGTDAAVGNGTAATALRTTTASDSPDAAVLGATADAGVVTDTTGTISGKLRGLVTLLLAAKNSLDSLDNSVDGNYLNVNMNLAGTDAAVGNGTAATALRVTIASDSTMAGTGVEDAVETAGGTLLMAGTVRRDTPAASSGASGDNSTLNTNEAGGVWTTLTPALAGGVSIFRSIDLDESEEEIKASAGTLYGYYFANLHATAFRYLKLYNATAANVTVGTTTPILTIPLPPASAGHISFAYGITFSTALCAAATTAVTDADTGAPGTNDVVFNAFYK